MNEKKGKYFYAVSKLSGYVLDVKDSCTRPGTLVIMQEKKVGLNENQLWYEDLVTGTIRTKLNPTMCLDVNENNYLVIDAYDCRSTKQRWSVTGNRRDRIEHTVEKGRYLEVETERRRAQVHISRFRHKDSQIWSIDHIDPDYFHIISETTGRALDVRGWNKKAGAVVITMKFNGCLTQQWYEDVRGGIRSRLNDFDLAVTNIQKDDNVHLQPHKDSLQMKNQLWTRSSNKIVNMFNPHMVVDVKEGEEDKQLTITQYKGERSQHWNSKGVWEKYGKKLF